jgi:hypothetical protein
MLGEEVTPNYFGVLGMTPALGRPLSEDDARPGAPLVVVISHGLWQQRFAGDAAVLGQTIILNSQPHVLVRNAEGGRSTNYSLAGVDVR